MQFSAKTACWPRLVALVGVAVAAITATPAHAKPQRIVSTNVCADQLALLLAPDRVVSVSFNAIDPFISNFAEEAKRIPANAARAEEIILLKPDLVLGDVYEGRRVTRFAETFGIKVQLIGAGFSIDDTRKIIRDTAGALGEEARGEAEIAKMDARFAAIRRDGPQVRALVYEPGGSTQSKGTLTHELLTAAGLHNMAEDLIGGSYGFVPLELVISSTPDLLVIDNTYPEQTSRTQSLLRHPAFRALKGRTAITTIPSRLWLCPGPWIAEAAERLAAEKSRLLDSRRAPLAQTQNRE
jgi:iron complex transport system substrate-binding protein